MMALFLAAAGHQAVPVPLELVMFRIGLGAILGLVGLVWIGQGAGLIPGSFMTGQSLWLGLGIVCLLLGLALILAPLRRGAGPRS